MNDPTASAPQLVSPVGIFNRRRSVAAVMGIAVAIVWWPAWGRIYDYYDVLPDRSSNLENLIIALEFAAPAAGYIVFSRMARTEGVVLWLRKFRRGYGNKVRFHRVLSSACSAMLSPLTIQDRSFRTYLFTGLLKIGPLLPLLIVTGLYVVLALTFLPYLLTDTQGSGGWSWASFLSGVVILALLPVWVSRKAGFDRMRGRRGLRKAIRKLGSIQRRKRSEGFVIFKCDDDIWRDVVSLALATSKVVVIDVTEPTQNLVWELSECYYRVLAAKIVLAVEEGSHDLDQLASQIHALLGNPTAVPISALRRSFFAYPATRAPLVTRIGQYLTLSRRLRRRLAEIVSA